MSADKNILVIDDEKACPAWLKHLAKGGYNVTCVTTRDEAVKTMRRVACHVLVMSYQGGSGNNAPFIQEIARKQPQCQVVMTFDQAQMTMVPEALHLGAYDYLIEPLREPLITAAAVERAAEKSRLIIENRLLAEQVKKHTEGLESVTRKLERLATIDDLTNLHNHNHFNEALTMELARSRRYGHTFSILIVTLNALIQYKQTHGQKAGDLLLYSLAQILDNAIRASDMLARYDNDEFALLLPETDDGGATMLADRIQRQVAAHPFPGRESLPEGKVTVRIGMACYPKHGDNPATLIQHALNASLSPDEPPN